MPVDNSGRTVRAWDLPTRLFHWALVVLIILAPITNKMGSATFYLHKVNGYLILSLVLYRILWGFVGGTTARFRTFVRPFAAFGYLGDLVRNRSRHFLGHNPLGGMMVLALLAAAGGQALFGLMTLDDIPATIEGPFASKVAKSTAEWVSVWHRRGFKIILALVALHVLANLFYTFVKKDNLIRPMLTGVKPAGAYEDVAENQPGSLARAALCLALAIVVVFGSVWVFGSAPFR
ncbi:MAG TPA: cytochrome b/b6 domain-containing protein [Beijerinckiaceae bacterium]|nr:cytochrome b/b6 domain-containing protein [Beijerinckiaceae bacterium]